MPDEVKTPVVEDVKKEESKPVEPEKKEESPELTLEEMKAELAKARREAAKYRTEKNSIEKEKLTELQQIQKEMSDLKAELFNAKRNAVAAKYGLPDALADRLKGETPEELEEDAKALAALVVKPAEKPQPPQISPTAPTQTPRLTREAIEKMSATEINKNWDAIQASLSNKELK